MPFIVIEGLDGAGKSTQVALLRNLAEQRGKVVEYVHFPRFDTPVYGELIAKFLRGELGSVSEVDPYLTALIYAGDRANAAEMISAWLSEGKFVVIDRYVCSNIAYQCAKFDDQATKTKLREWILNLEYGYNKIPHPDLTLFLDVPFKFTEKKLTETRIGDDRDYLNGKADIHEASLDLQRRVREAYLAEDALSADFHVVGCGDSDGNMLPPTDIFNKIVDKIEPLL